MLTPQTRDCIKEYKGKLGLLINGFHKMDMFKAYAMRLTTDKPLGVLGLKAAYTSSLRPHTLVVVHVQGICYAPDHRQASRCLRP